MATYLELVNTAILESGVDLDPLTSSNFASPPDQSMYRNMKTWVSDAWNELQIARDEYEFRTARATVFIYPAMYVENGLRATAPPVGATYNGDDTDSDFTIAQVITHSGSWAAGTAKATLYFKTAAEQYKLNEYFDELTPTPANNIFQSKGRGRYNFVNDAQKTDISEILYETMYVQTTGGSTIQTNSADSQLRKIEMIPWAQWAESFEQSLTYGMPQYATITPEGDLDFYPRPDKQYVLHFTYTTSQNALTLYTDTPSTIPSQYHPMIAWAAVMKWASWDSQSTKYTRAAKQFDFFNHRLEKNKMPVVSWARSRYDFT